MPDTPATIPIDVPKSPDTNLLRKAAMRPRVTVVETVYHQPSDGEAKVLTTDTGFCYFLDGDEQPYERIIKLTDDVWREIDYGWLMTRPSVLIIHNIKSLTAPPDVTQDNPNANVIELAVVVKVKQSKITMHDPKPEVIPPITISLIHPGRSIRIPYPGSNLVARCLSGVAKVKISAV